MYKNFEDILGKVCINGLNKKGIIEFTDIQKIAIPKILSKKDYIIFSKTGSGKTLAYLLPIFKNIKMDIVKPQAIVLAPTHELASQIHKEAKFLNESCFFEINIGLFIGGSSIKRQIENLKINKPKIIIGSMGRIIDLIKLKKLKLHYIKSIVIDEADRMIDEVNIENLKKIIKSTLKDRQIIMVSATMSNIYLEKSKNLMNNPEIIKIEDSLKNILPINIEHLFFISERRNKINVIRKLYNAINIEKGIIFVNNINDLEMISKKLNFYGIKSIGLSGCFIPKERKKSINKFRKEDIKFLVSSDIAARGIDVKDVEYIINFDMPKDSIFYTHRAGRTGRMNKKGYCITIIEKKDIRYIRKFSRELGIKIVEKEIKCGKVINKR